MTRAAWSVLVCSRRRGRRCLAPPGLLVVCSRLEALVARAWRVGLSSRHRARPSRIALLGARPWCALLRGHVPVPRSCREERPTPSSRRRYVCLCVKHHGRHIHPLCKTGTFVCASSVTEGTPILRAKPIRSLARQASRAISPTPGSTPIPRRTICVSVHVAAS